VLKNEKSFFRISKNFIGACENLPNNEMIDDKKYVMPSQISRGSLLPDRGQTAELFFRQALWHSWC